MLAAVSTPLLAIGVALLLRQGTVGSEVRIHNASELIEFSRNVNSGTSFSGTTVFLDSDIAFTDELSEDFEPIGKGRDSCFLGSFDGQGHIISSLKISSPLQYVGLFGYSNGLTVRNVVIDGSSSIESLYSFDYSLYAEGAIGYCYPDNIPCIIENIVNMGSVTFNGDGLSGDYMYIGGIAGCLFSSLEYKSSVKNCANYGHVSYIGESGGTAYIGGIVGSSSENSVKLSIHNCINHGSMAYNGTSDTLLLGGIAGVCQNCVVENCVSTASITSSYDEFIGAISGADSTSTISHCYWSESVNYDVSGSSSGSTITGSTKFNADFVLSKTVSVGKYTGNSLIEALNAAADYYTLRDYSRWLLNKNENAVSFTVNNAKSPLTISSQIILLPSLAGEGVLWFDGWYTDSSCTTPFTGNEVDKDTGLYGKLVENHNAYTITFDTRGGSSIEPITTQFGTVVTLPSTTTREHCNIVFWENDYGDRIARNFAVPAHNITLYAVWLCTRIAAAEELVDFSRVINSEMSLSGTTVFLDSDIEFTERLSEKFETIDGFSGTFDGQGHTINNLRIVSSSQYVGLFGSSDGITIRNVVIGDSCSVVSLTKNYYAFISGIICGVTLSSRYSIIENIVNMASVTFHGDVSGSLPVILGGIVGFAYSSGGEYGLAVKNCANYGAITQSGKSDFLSTGGVVGLPYYSGSSYVYIQNCLNYGSISYDKETSILSVGGISGIGTKLIIENCVSAGEITSGEMSGYKFVGSIVGYVKSDPTEIIHSFWTSDVGYNNVNGSGTPEIDNETSQVELDLAFVRKLNEYTAKNSSWNRWLLNTNSAPVSFKVDNYKGFALNSKIMLLPDLADNSERTFSGWYKDDLLTSPFAQNEIGSSTVLYGMYCGSKYSVTLDVNGGEVSSIPTLHPMLIECNGVYGELPTPRWKKHTFIGWFTMVYGGREIKGGDKVTDFSNHTLYAQWREKDEISLIFVIAVPVGVVVVVAVIVIIAVYVLLRKRKKEGGYERFDRKDRDAYYDDRRRDGDFGYEEGRENSLSKPLIPCTLGDGDDARDTQRHYRSIAETRDVDNDSVVAVSAGSVLEGLYPEEYTRPAMKEALLAVGINDDSAGIVCDACKSIARTAMAEGRLFEGFTEEDAAAVAMYTFDFGQDGDFEDNPYRIINKTLVDKDPSKLQKTSGLLYLVMKALRKLPRVTGKALYRGVRSEVNTDENHYYRGNVMTWSALSSTSPDMEAIKAFLARGSDTGKARGTLFIIDEGWGYDIQPYSAFPTEAEILLEPERQFCVVSVIQGKGLTIINLKMLDTPLSVPGAFEER